MARWGGPFEALELPSGFFCASLEALELNPVGGISPLGVLGVPLGPFGRAFCGTGASLGPLLGVTRGHWASPGTQNCFPCWFWVALGTELASSRWRGKCDEASPVPDTQRSTGVRGSSPAGGRGSTHLRPCTVILISLRKNRSHGCCCWTRGRASGSWHRKAPVVLIIGRTWVGLAKTFTDSYSIRTPPHVVGSRVPDDR